VTTTTTTIASVLIISAEQHHYHPIPGATNQPPSTKGSEDKDRQHSQSRGTSALLSADQTIRAAPHCQQNRPPSLCPSKRINARTRTHAVNNRQSDRNNPPFRSWHMPLCQCAAEDKASSRTKQAAAPCLLPGCVAACPKGTPGAPFAINDGPACL
jgi:hypothetical protein